MTTPREASLDEFTVSSGQFQLLPRLVSTPSQRHLPARIFSLRKSNKPLVALQEQLYGQDAKERAIAILRICTLLQDSSYAQQALQRPALISLLARLLREDGKRSLDVCLCVVAFFCALSSFAQLQGHLLENQVGARTIEILSVCAQRTSLQVRKSTTLLAEFTAASHAASHCASNTILCCPQGRCTVYLLQSSQIDLAATD